MFIYFLVSNYDNNYKVRYKMLQQLRMNPFHATGLFLSPRKHQKMRGFLMFSGDIEKDHYHEMV